MSQVASASAPIGCQIFSERYSASGFPTAARKASDRTSLSVDEYWNFVPAGTARSFRWSTAFGPPAPCPTIVALNIGTAAGDWSPTFMPEDMVSRWRRLVSPYG